MSHVFAVKGRSRDGQEKRPRAQRDWQRSLATARKHPPNAGAVSEGAGSTTKQEGVQRRGWVSGPGSRCRRQGHAMQSPGLGWRSRQIPSEMQADGVVNAVRVLVRVSGAKCWCWGGTRGVCRCRCRRRCGRRSSRLGRTDATYSGRRSSSGWRVRSSLQVEWKSGEGTADAGGVVVSEGGAGKKVKNHGPGRMSVDWTSRAAE